MLWECSGRLRVRQPSCRFYNPHPSQTDPTPPIGNSPRMRYSFPSPNESGTPLSYRSRKETRCLCLPTCRNPPLVPALGCRVPRQWNGLLHRRRDLPRSPPRPVDFAQQRGKHVHFRRTHAMQPLRQRPHDELLRLLLPESGRSFRHLRSFHPAATGRRPSPETIRSIPYPPRGQSNLGSQRTALSSSAKHSSLNSILLLSLSTRSRMPLLRRGPVPPHSKE